eukprot:gene47502-biopygen35191
MSENHIKYVVKNNLFTGCPCTYEDIKYLRLHLCATCQMGRMRASNRKKRDDRTRYSPLECIAVDYKGPFSTLTIHSNRGFYLINDHRSQAVWSYPCKNKNEETLFKILEHFFSMINEYPFRARIFHCDDDSVENGGLISRYLLSLGLEMHVSPPHVPHQNGQIERAMQTTLDKARTLMIGGGASHRFWDYAVVMATYILMRTPNLKNLKTPLETLTGIVPDMQRLIPFFCPGLYHVTREERHSSWDPKALPCRFLGYDDKLQSCYKIFCLQTMRVLSRKDCIWDPSQVHHLASELLEQRDENEHFIEFDNPDLEADDDGNLIGDNVAPYFALDPVEYEMQKQLDEDHAHFALDRWSNDAICLNVHMPIALPPDPKSCDEAVNGPHGPQWVEALEKELNSLKDHGTMIDAEDQTGPAMKTKWVLKYTYTADYQLKCKARLVVCGYSQRPELDYGETFAPTTS